MGSESSDVVKFDLGPLLQGETRIAKCYSATLCGSVSWQMFKAVAIMGTV